MDYNSTTIVPIIERIDEQDRVDQPQQHTININQNRNNNNINEIELYGKKQNGNYNRLESDGADTFLNEDKDELVRNKGVGYIALDGNVYYLEEENEMVARDRTYTRYAGYFLEYPTKQQIKGLVCSVSFWVFAISLFMLILEFVVYLVCHDNLFQLLYMVPDLVYRGQLHRLFFPLILHGGPMHLLGNSTFLLRICLIMEKRWGWKRTLFIYLATNFGSSLMIMATSDPYKASLGASGAILGFVGVIVFESLFAMKEFSKATRYNFLITTLYHLLIIIINSFGPQVSMAGHMGGFILGFLMAGGLFLQRKSARITMTVVTCIYLIIIIIVPICIAINK
ncbi:hypothetical protein DFA_03288 [Cavenderia fasciculata]|uniref:rhomboid protease n=1 Tax=Cavenderia fasciculata TaxID=261658 RepID=F4PH58_CACFS|nr:uncharacterized protein DFA_03288 [Cavenderia fasciculata]EGG25042.1 hypothetical protein DFA_03288 [Cavenderia fasciculata]|eukprot:XP_004362893.1 hypothetical protein DFA_03288 [Cavenderia fasciculata]